MIPEKDMKQLRVLKDLEKSTRDLGHDLVSGQLTQVRRVYVRELLESDLTARMKAFDQEE